MKKTTTKNPRSKAANVAKDVQDIADGKESKKIVHTHVFGECFKGTVTEFNDYLAKKGKEEIEQSDAREQMTSDLFKALTASGGNGGTPEGNGGGSANGAMFDFSPMDAYKNRAEKPKGGLSLADMMNIIEGPKPKARIDWKNVLLVSLFISVLVSAIMITYFDQFVFAPLFKSLGL